MSGALKLGVLISGSGTNLQAIIDAVEKKTLEASIQIVLSNRPDAGGLDRARRHGLKAEVIDHRKFASREDFDRAMAQRLRDHSVELVVCAGFMRVLSRVMLDAFPDRIMNIHPALLPSFPGLHVQKAALDHGVKLTGCTVHFAAETVDAGPIIIQAAVPVFPDDDEDSLSARILEQEHRIYPEAIRLFQQGRLQIHGRKVLIKDYQPSQTASAISNPPAR